MAVEVRGVAEASMIVDETAVFSAQIFREPVYRRYFAPVNSYSFVHTVFMIFLAIFLPLIIAYNSTSERWLHALRSRPTADSSCGADFWLKENTVYAQPVVAYRYTAIFVFSGTRLNLPLVRLLNPPSSVYVSAARQAQSATTGRRPQF